MIEALLNISVLEWIAVIGGLGYVILAAREHIACWGFALIGTAASLVMLWDVDLLMDAALNGFYCLMAVYGYMQWRFGGSAGNERQIRKWQPTTHCWVILSIVSLSLLSGYCLDNYTDAAWPYLDSATTIAAVITTFMVAYKILENWLYWIVIDAVSVGIYIEREIYLYAGLFLLYTVIAVFGYVEWRKRLSHHAQ